MEVLQDYKELFELLNRHGVDYLIAGSYALAFHGAPRFTGDIDIFVKPNQANARKIIGALSDFGFQLKELGEDDFSKEGFVVQLGVLPVRVGFLTSLTGLTWDEAAKNMIQGKYGDVSVFFLGRADFIKNKKNHRQEKRLGRHRSSW